MTESIINNISKALFGKNEEIELALVTILARGHLLIEDIPGVGKTTLAKATAKSLKLEYSRIQFTPDMLPSDVLGLSIYNQRDQKFDFKVGPIKANIVLADEINRASPKTQSSLLEAMAERQFTVDGMTYLLEEPFFVVATQNPIEFEGTFPLPEAQLDRFMMRLKLGYPPQKLEMSLFENKREAESLDAVATKEDIIKMSKNADDVSMKEAIKKFIVELASVMRESDDVLLAPSPRATLDLYKASKAYAFIKGRGFVVPEDIKFLVPYVWGHRIYLNPELRFTGITAIEYLKELVGKVPFELDDRYEK